MIEDSAGALPCRFGRVMYQKNNGKPEHKADTTKADVFSCPDIQASLYNKGAFHLAGNYVYKPIS